jgi:hypothetical protein
VSDELSPEWYCEIMGQELGPMFHAELQEMARAGQLAPGDRIRRGVDGYWMAARLGEGLFAERAST